MTHGDVLMAESVAKVGENYPELAYAWMESALHDALPECSASLSSDQRLIPPNRRERYGPWGEPYALWVSMITQPEPLARKRVSTYSRSSWKKFLDKLDAIPHRVELDMVTLDAKGHPTRASARIGVEHVRDKPGWLHFELHATESLYPWRGRRDAQELWVSFLRRQAELHGSTFGNLTNDNSRERTALEADLGAWSEDTIPMSRETLRGYSWVTICAKEIVERLGGVQVLRAANAFTEIIELVHGSFLLRATPTFDEYDEVAIEKVFRAVAPVLIAGRTKRIKGFEHWKLAYDVDAADFRD
jgi:hypothetical protein